MKKRPRKVFLNMGVSRRTSNSTFNVVEFKRQLYLPENVIFIEQFRRLIS